MGRLAADRYGPTLAKESFTLRLAIVIVSVTAIAVGLVHLRRTEIATRHQIQRLSAEQIRLRRALWDQQVRLGELTAPQRVQQRADEMALGLSHKAEQVESSAAVMQH